MMNDYRIEALSFEDRTIHRMIFCLLDLIQRGS